MKRRQERPPTALTLFENLVIATRVRAEETASTPPPRINLPLESLKIYRLLNLFHHWSVLSVPVQRDEKTDVNVSRLFIINRASILYNQSNGCFLYICTNYINSSNYIHPRKEKSRLEKERKGNWTNGWFRFNHRNAPASKLSVSCLAHVNLEHKAISPIDVAPATFYHCVRVSRYYLQ